jgi:hypothetical protein
MRPDKNYPIAAIQPDQEIQINQINSLNSQLKIQAKQNMEVDYYKYYFLIWIVNCFIYCNISIKNLFGTNQIKKFTAECFLRIFFTFFNSCF